jgi:hypothetical protein
VKPKTWEEQGMAAFPIPNSVEPGAYSPETGMSLRDYFAAHALAAIIPELNMFFGRNSHAPHPGGNIIAESAYRIADAMIAERKK